MQFKVGDCRRTTSWWNVYDISCRCGKPYTCVWCEFCWRGALFHNFMTEARRKCENVTDKAFGRTHHAEWGIPGEDISSKCTFATWFLQFWNTSRTPKMAPEAKIAQVTSENQIFDGRLKRNWDEPNGQKSDKCRKDGTFNPDLSPSGLQRMHFWKRQHFCKKMCV